MNQVLIANSYFYKLDAKQWRFRQPYPPLGTLIAVSVLKRAGFSVKFLDNGLMPDTTVVKNELNTATYRYFILYDDGFNYLTKMCLSVMREAAFDMIRNAKQNNCTVVICNSDASDHYKEYLKAGADFVIRGEGEETLEELLVTIKHQENPEKIKSIAYQSGNEILVNPSRSVIKDLDALPLPAWDLVDIEAYRKIWKKHHGYFSLNIATTRGCPYKCNWCAKPIYGNRYNARSPENVVAEIEMLLTLYKPDHFWMSDDIFGLKPGWVREFCDWVNRKKLVFRYKIQSRADLLLINDSLEALARSGAETVWIGAESGSQKILDAMDKGITVNQIKVATSLLKAQRIKVAYFLQFGYSGETVDDIQKTIDMVLENMPDEIGISVSYPLPGTQFYERVQSELKKKQNWVDSDDLDMMYPATYQPRFYKILHRYVHGRYRIQRGFNALRGFKLFDLKALASMIYYLPGSLINRIRLDKLSHRHVT